MPARKRERKLFVDLGSGPHRGRAFDIAQRRHEAGKKGKIVAVDLLEHHKYEKPPNLELVQSGAREYLEGLEPGSVDVINFDLSAGTVESETGYRRMYNPPAEETHVMLSKELGNAMKRALKRNGRIFINTSRNQAESIRRELEEQGFRVSRFPFSSIWHRMQSRAFSTREIMKYAGRQGFIGNSVQIVARKGKK